MSRQLHYAPDETAGERTVPSIKRWYEPLNDAVPAGRFGTVEVYLTGHLADVRMPVVDVYVPHLVPRSCDGMVRIPLLPATLHVLRVILTSPIDSLTECDGPGPDGCDSVSVQSELPAVTAGTTVHPASMFILQLVLKSTPAPVKVIDEVPLLATNAPLSSVEIVESSQDSVASPPAVTKVVPVDPDLDVSTTVAVAVTMQVALPPVHVQLADAFGANMQAAIRATTASSPNLGISRI